MAGNNKKGAGAMEAKLWRLTIVLAVAASLYYVWMSLTCGILTSSNYCYHD